MKRVLPLLLLVGCATQTVKPVDTTLMPATLPPSTVIITSPVTTTTVGLTAEQVAYLETMAA